MPPERVPPERAVLFSFKEKHPHIYSFLFQVILLIITFECTIAIARYGPERDDPVPASSLTTVRRTLPRIPLSVANSTTLHICKDGAREDYMDLGPRLTVRIRSSLSFFLSFFPFSDLLIHKSTSLNPCIHTNPKTQAITPYTVLCPSTPFFLLSLLTFTTGMTKFYTMHKADFWLGNGFFVMLVTIVPSLDRRNILVSLQIMVPTCIWIVSVFIAASMWFFKTCSPRTYEKHREARREMQGQRERSKDVEAMAGGQEEVRAVRETQGEIGEET
jgi:hypothetical protein